MALWQAQATSGGNSPEESSVRAQMRCQGGLGQFCSIHQKGALDYIYEAKASGAWRSQASQGTLNVPVVPPKSCHAIVQGRQVTALRFSKSRTPPNKTSLQMHLNPVTVSCSTCKQQGRARKGAQCDPNLGRDEDTILKGESLRSLLFEDMCLQIKGGPSLAKSFALRDPKCLLRRTRILSPASVKGQEGRLRGETPPEKSSSL